jgi:hypothetical protein
MFAITMSKPRKRCRPGVFVQRIEKPPSNCTKIKLRGANEDHLMKRIVTRKLLDQHVVDRNAGHSDQNEEDAGSRIVLRRYNRSGGHCGVHPLLALHGSPGSFECPSPRIQVPISAVRIRDCRTGRSMRVVEHFLD